MGIIQFIQNILNFVNVTLIPFIIALAFLFFIWNAARYFIIQGAEPESREKAKRLALWGILAFVFILSLWGIVNMLTGSLNFGAQNPITPDYIQSGGGGSGGTSGVAADCPPENYTSLGLGFGWCGTSGSNSTYTPGGPGPTTNPNNGQQTVKFNF